jgi:hypothetical protein
VVAVKRATRPSSLTLRAEPTAFRSFYDAHHGQGREDICGDGADIRPMD